MRTVWFHREFTRLQGGHLKHSHYFGHVAATTGFAPRISFTGASPGEAAREECQGLWPAGEAGYASQWAPRGADLLFVAGMDWRYLAANGYDSLPNPRINLIQGVRHGRPGTELHGFLKKKAVRICVSQEVAESINATGRANRYRPGRCFAGRLCRQASLSPDRRLQATAIDPGGNKATGNRRYR